MSLVVRDLMVDCADSPGLARFWGNVLRRPVEWAPEGFWVRMPDGNQPSAIFFREVADAKQAKNRLHFDLNPVDGSLVAEVERLTALGARVLARRRRGFGLGWVVLADPEDNEFCVTSSDAEVAAVEACLDAEDEAGLDVIEARLDASLGAEDDTADAVELYACVESEEPDELR